MSKKTKTLAGSIAAIFAAATLALFGISGENVIEVDYEIKESSNLVEMSVYPPESAEVDIVELYCNDQLVTKTVLPNGKLKSIPFVFAELGNLELRFYKLNEVIGVGNFDDKTLYVAFKDDITVDSGTEDAENDEEY